mmetsp:Transcript_71913/g.83577  ORF Transcript_71913/g.83577 Transcript_71913/m.83577 type:complete len:218 (-) Transcript_71913:1267-1920(-)
MVVFGAQPVIDDHKTGQSARDRPQGKHHRQESKDVVYHTLPQGCENEFELQKQGGKWDKARQQNNPIRLNKRLFGWINGTRDHVDFSGVCTGGNGPPKRRPNECKREAHKEPHGEQTKKRLKGYCATRPCGSKGCVADSKDKHHNRREKQADLKDQEPRLLSAKLEVHPSREVAGNKRLRDEQNKQHAHQPSPIGGADETQTRNPQRCGDQHGDLGA